MARGFKSGGRTKGVKNKNTLITETFIEYLLDGQVVKFKEEFNKLTGAQYINQFIKLCELSINKKDYISANNAILDKLNNILKSKSDETSKQ